MPDRGAGRGQLMTKLTLYSVGSVLTLKQKVYLPVRYPVVFRLNWYVPVDGSYVNRFPGCELLGDWGGKMFPIGSITSTADDRQAASVSSPRYDEASSNASESGYN